MPVPCRLGPPYVVLFGAISGIVAGAEPVRAEASLVVNPEIWIGGWAAAVASLSALYIFDRRHRANHLHAARRVSPVPMTRDHIVPAATPTVAAVAALATPEPEPSPAPRRSIEQLLKRKPGAPADAPLPLSPRADAEPRAEEPALLRRLRERGALLASVAAPAELGVAEAAAAASQAPSEPAAEDRRTEAPEPVAPVGTAARCAELREAGRFADAVRLARDGLARYADAPGALLLELSRATFALGEHEEAVDSARDALFVWRSRETVEHLIWILTALHRFEPEDGDGLRRAASRHPSQALLRHAVAVYELSYGSRDVAEAELRAALALDPDPERRAAIERDLTRLLGPGALDAPAPA